MNCYAVGRDDQNLHFRLDLRQDSKFSIVYGYTKIAFKQEPDTEKDIRSEALYSIFSGFGL